MCGTRVPHTNPSRHRRHTCQHRGNLLGLAKASCGNPLHTPLQFGHTANNLVEQKPRIIARIIACGTAHIRIIAHILVAFLQRISNRPLRKLKRAVGPQSAKRGTECGEGGIQPTGAVIAGARGVYSADEADARGDPSEDRRLFPSSLFWRQQAVEKDHLDEAGRLLCSVRLVKEDNRFFIVIHHRLLHHRDNLLGGYSRMEDHLYEYLTRRPRNELNRSRLAEAGAAFKDEGGRAAAVRLIDGGLAPRHAVANEAAMVLRCGG